VLTRLLPECTPHPSHHTTPHQGPASSPHLCFVGHLVADEAQLIESSPHQRGLAGIHVAQHNQVQLGLAPCSQTSSLLGSTVARLQNQGRDLRCRRGSPALFHQARCICGRSYNGLVQIVRATIAHLTWRHALLPCYTPALGRPRPCILISAAAASAAVSIAAAAVRPADLLPVVGFLLLLLLLLECFLRLLVVWLVTGPWSWPAHHLLTCLQLPLLSWSPGCCCFQPPFLQEVSTSRTRCCPFLPCCRWQQRLSTTE